MGFFGNSLSVEASIIGLLFWIAPAQYKVVREEISLHWNSFESEQPRVIRSSATDLGAQETRVQSLFECKVTRMGGNIFLWLKKTWSMRNFPLAINKRLGWRILVIEEQCETLLGEQTRFG